VVPSDSPAAGKTALAEALPFHLDGLHADGEPVPAAESVEV
jgi:hypothetical protein